MARVQFSFYRSKSKVKLSSCRSRFPTLAHSLQMEALHHRHHHHQQQKQPSAESQLALSFCPAAYRYTYISGSCSLFIFAPANFNCSAANTNNRDTRGQRGRAEGAVWLSTRLDSRILHKCLPSHRVVHYGPRW